MTTSDLFANYTLGSQVSLSCSMNIKTGLFFLSDFLLYHYPISSIINYYYVMEHWKKKKKKKKQIKKNVP